MVCLSPLWAGRAQQEKGPLSFYPISCLTFVFSSSFLNAFSHPGMKIGGNRHSLTCGGNFLLMLDETRWQNRVSDSSSHGHLSAIWVLPHPWQITPKSALIPESSLWQGTKWLKTSCCLNSVIKILSQEAFIYRLTHIFRGTRNSSFLRWQSISSIFREARVGPYFSITPKSGRHLEGKNTEDILSRP